MFQPKLTTEPASFDEHGQPCYPVSQGKGLIEHQDNRLLEDALADGYVASVAATLHRWIRREVSLAAGGRKLDLLELGGGAGGLFEWVKDDARTYINVEPGRPALAGRALERLTDARYAAVRCSAEDIPLADESVDVIISTASFDHIPDYRRALSEVRRLLREGGVFLLTLNNRRSWWKLLLSGTDYLRRREEEIAREHYIQWSFAECEAHLSEFLRVSRMSTTTFLPYVPRVWRYALPASDLLGRLLLRGYGANIVAVCRKEPGSNISEAERGK
ncbi:MAG: class I SAM-dependent methyltransferase [Acidobacteriota bacterium]|nr:class I SAM-dependent methyltransferase [Acidobacteriota bacterium]